MGKEKAEESEKSEMEEGEVDTATDEETEDDEKKEDMAPVVVPKGGGEKEDEEESDREVVRDSGKTVDKQKQQRKQALKVTSRPENKAKEAAIASEREIRKGSPRRKNAKEDPSETLETVDVDEEDNKVEKRDGKEIEGKKRNGSEEPQPEPEPEVVGEAEAEAEAETEARAGSEPESMPEPEPEPKPENEKSPGTEIMSEDDEETHGEDTEVDEDEVDKLGDDEDNENTEDEEEGHEVEKDLGLTMSSSWAPLSESAREILKVSKAVREDREKERDVDTNREVQSESLKQRGRARESDEDVSKERSRQKKQKLSEPPLLSLSLPDTSLHLSASEPSNHTVKSKSKSASVAAPKISEVERSVRSFGPTQSQSNGYTNSLSLSLSHPCFHTASCSLTQTSVDDKEGTTCSSRQVTLLKGDPTEGSRGSSLGGHEQLFHTATDGSYQRSKHRAELPLYHKLLQSGNPQLLHGGSGNGEGTRDSSRSFMDERTMESIGRVRGNGELSQGSEQYRWKDDGSLQAGGLERSRTSRDKHWSVHRDNRERHRQELWPNPSQSTSFQDRRLEVQKHSHRDRRTDGDAGRELSLSGSRDVGEQDEDSAGPDKRVIVGEGEGTAARAARKVERSWLHDIVKEPIPRMAQKLQEVSDSFLGSLKKCLQDTLGSIKRKDECFNLQRILQGRSDLTQNSLLQAHRTQLEILVALKTGITAFLHQDVSLSAAALAEIFDQQKCRNVVCQSQLPADDCECKVCSSKTGFCNACMCVVCSKFDFDFNTCRWIGCDFCLHWCHSECGLEKGHISSGISTRGTSGDSVMQFRCIGCAHTSELYGFIEDVFTNCAKDWPADILAGELQCVRKLFHRSEDLRGKQLFRKAEQLLVKLNTSRDTEAVCQSMMKFFAAGEKEPVVAARVNAGTDASPIPREKEMTSRLVDAVRDAIDVIKAPNGDSHDLEKARAALQFYDHEVEEKKLEASELQHVRAWQKAQIEELESIVQIRQAEARMFQIRADEVRREAEGLQRIVQAKTEKIEEDFNQKLVKLRLNDSEEKRQKWSEEVRHMERAQQEYSAMKMNMVHDIRDLLQKVKPKVHRT